MARDLSSWGGDTFDSVENLIGTAYNDRLTGQ